MCFEVVIDAWVLVFESKPNIFFLSIFCFDEMLSHVIAVMICVCILFVTFFDHLASPHVWKYVLEISF